MDYGKSFSFVFEDKDWLRKLGIPSLVLFGAMLALIFPAILFILGYQVAIGRNVYKGEKNPLPEPENFGEMFRDGGVLFGVMMVYYIPLWILICAAVGLVAAAGGASESGADTLGATLGVFGALMYCLYLVLAIVLALFIHAGMAQYIRKGTFSACMQFREIWEMVKSSIGDYILVILCVMAAGIVSQIAIGVSVITVCGPLILMFPAMLWQVSVSGHLLGQLATKHDNDGMNKEEYYDAFA